MSVVDIVIPTYRGQPQECSSALTQMILATVCRCGGHAQWECPNGKHSVRVIPSTLGSSVVHWSRNKALTTALYGMDPEYEQAGRPQAEFLFLMDDDMVCNPGDLSRLLAAKRSIVTGIATIRRDPPRPNIRFFNQEDKTWWYIDQWDWEGDDLFEVDGVGAAYMLVRRAVFEEMGKAYRNCHFERLADKQKYPERAKEIDAYWDGRMVKRHERFKKAIARDGDWHDADCWWFTFLDDALQDQDYEWGEDISFCWKAKKLGYKIWADPKVLPGHLGNYAYSVRDHRGYVELRQEAGANVNQWDGKTGLHGVDRK